MTKWPLQKPTYRTTQTHVEHQRNRHLEKTIFVFFGFVFSFLFLFIISLKNSPRNVEALNIKFLLFHKFLCNLIAQKNILNSLIKAYFSINTFK